MPRISLQALLKYWVPPVLWMAVIIVFSGDTLSFGRTAAIVAWFLGLFGVKLSLADLHFINFMARKGVHVITYFVLSLLVFRGVRGTAEGSGWKLRWMWAALGITLAVACLDEYRQTFFPGRTGTVADLGYDGAGAVLAQVLVWWRTHRARGVNSSISAAPAASAEER